MEEHHRPSVYWQEGRNRHNRLGTLREWEKNWFTQVRKQLPSLPACRQWIFPRGCGSRGCQHVSVKLFQQDSLQLVFKTRTYTQAHVHKALKGQLALEAELLLSPERKEFLLDVVPSVTLYVNFVYLSGCYIHSSQNVWKKSSTCHIFWFPLLFGHCTLAAHPT